MSRSLRSQLLVRMTATTVLVSAVAALTIFLLLRRKLLRDFDAVLTSKAAAMATLIELDHGELVVEFADQPASEFTRVERPDYYEAWDSAGRVLARSPRLGNRDLEKPTPTLIAPAYESAALPDGRPGRVVALAVIPRLEPGQREEAPTGEPLGKDAEVDPAELRSATVTLAIAADSLDVDSTTTKLGWLMVGASVAIVLALIGALAWVVARALQPLAALATQIAAVDERALGSRFSQAGAPAELVPVIARTNELMQRLERAFERERTFSADVAHELRTPLAGLRATLDVALSRSRESAEYRAALETCNAISGNLQRLVETLLSLSDAAAAESRAEWSYVDVDSLVRSAWTPFEERSQNKELSVTMAAPADVILHTDAGKLRVVLSNLFDNAVEYADDRGVVSISAAVCEGRLRIRIRNSGCRLSDEQLSHVFERFWRGDAARHGSVHVGLGLALCRRIVDSLAGTVDASCEDGWFAVTVVFPQECVELAETPEPVENSI